MTIQEIVESIREDGMNAKREGVPRVSSVLTKIKPMYLFNNPVVRERGLIAMNRGTRVHAHAESAIKGGAPFIPRSPVLEDERGYVDSFTDFFLAWRQAHLDYELFVEVPLGCADWPLRGTCDLLAIREYTVEDETEPRYDLIILDWKTGKRLYQSNFPQVMAYKLMVHKSLLRLGIKDYTIQSQLVFLKQDGSRAISQGCHQRDIPVVNDCVEHWVKQYKNDSEFRRKHDHGVRKELERNASA